MERFNLKGFRRFWAIAKAYWLDSGKFSEKVRFHQGFRLRTANKDGNYSSAYGRRVSGFFKPRILEELPTLQLRIGYRSKFFWFLSASLEGLFVGVKLF
jgi:hypothetical protein